jgi:AcrR family transcriptional regulator
MATQQQRNEATRSLIVSAARALFLRDGVDATSTEAILTEAGISRGALYHHFPSKRDVLAAVYELEAADVIRRAVASAKPAESAIDTLIRTSLAWLREARNPDVARLLLQDGPASLGIQRAERSRLATASAGRCRASRRRRMRGRWRWRRSSSPPEC